MNQKQKEMQAKLEQIKKNKPQFAGKNTNGMTAVKATKQNQHGAKINAPRKAEIWDLWTFRGTNSEFSTQIRFLNSHKWEEN